MIKLTEEEITRERFRREDRKDSLPAAILSVAVHGALFAGLFTVFQWNTAPETVYAELWAPEDVSGGTDPSGVAEKVPEETGRDEADAPEKKAAEPEPEPEPRPEPKPEPEPAAPPEPAGPTPEELAAEQAREAARLEEEQIARQAREEMEARRAEEERIAQERARAEEIERMRQEAIEAERRRAQEEEKRLEEERLAQERLAEAARKAEEAKKAEEARRAEEARIAEEQRKAEEARIAEEKRQAEEAARKAAAEKKAREEAEERRRVAQRFREQELARLSAKVDPNAQRSGTTTGDRRNFRRSLTGSALATWSNQVRSCIRPNITIDVPATTRPGQYRAVYSLQLLPTGEQVGTPKLVTPSGWPAYDAAVARAIRRCNPLPRPGAGEDMPREISLSFDPVEDKQ
ncbi:MAG: cell envelope integrity protein TolA [Sutterella wadsworthensis]|nr:cell envelope integrity protein TolA [Sutterella wadsworthensis]